jgi:hypothetical protein
MITGPSVVSEAGTDFVALPLVIETDGVVPDCRGGEGLHRPAAARSTEPARAKATSAEMERIVKITNG